MSMDAKYAHILRKFCLIGTPVSCERYGFGHINETYLVLTDTGPAIFCSASTIMYSPMWQIFSTISPPSPPICGSRSRKRTAFYI